MGAIANPDIFKAYDIRGLYGSELDAGVAKLIGRAFARVIAGQEGKQTGTLRLGLGDGSAAAGFGLGEAAAAGGAGVGAAVWPWQAVAVTSTARTSNANMARVRVSATSVPFLGSGNLRGQASVSARNGG